MTKHEEDKVRIEKLTSEVNRLNMANEVLRKNFDTRGRELEVVSRELNTAQRELSEAICDLRHHHEKGTAHRTGIYFRDLNDGERFYYNGQEHIKTVRVHHGVSVDNPFGLSYTNNIQISDGMTSGMGDLVEVEKYSRPMPIPGTDSYKAMHGHAN